MNSEVGVDRVVCLVECIPRISCRKVAHIGRAAAVFYLEIRTRVYPPVWARALAHRACFFYGSRLVEVVEERRSRLRSRVASYGEEPDCHKH